MGSAARRACGCSTPLPRIRNTSLDRFEAHGAHTYPFANRRAHEQGSHSFESCYKNIAGESSCEFRCSRDKPIREPRKFSSYRTIRSLLALLLAFLTASAPALAQEKKVAKQNGVDNSKMGASAPWRNTSTRISRGVTWQRPR